MHFIVQYALRDLILTSKKVILQWTFTLKVNVTSHPRLGINQGYIYGILSQKLYTLDPNLPPAIILLQTNKERMENWNPIINTYRLSYSFCAPILKRKYLNLLFRIIVNDDGNYCIKNVVMLNSYFNLTYYMTKKSWPILYSKELYQMGQTFLII